MIECFKRNKTFFIIAGAWLLCCACIFLWGYSTGRKSRSIEVATEIETLRGQLSIAQERIQKQTGAIRTLEQGITERDSIIEQRDSIITEREGLIKERQNIYNNLTTGEQRNIELIEYGESISQSIGDEIQRYLDREPAATEYD